MLYETFAQGSYAGWCGRPLTQKGVSAPNKKPLEMHDDPPVIANGYLETLEAAAGNPLNVPAKPVQFGEKPPVAGVAEHGAHSEEVLVELGSASKKHWVTRPRGRYRRR